MIDNGKWFGVLLILGLAQACQAPPPLAPDPHESDGRDSSVAVEAALPAAVGDEIMIAGTRFSTGRPVVLWFEEGGYNAYDTRIDEGTSPDYAESGMRYEPGRTTRSAPKRVLVRAGSTDIDELARGIDQFVVHFDVCGISRTCFKVLQHGRGLSVHFMLDIDGTIYQTLDVRETAWHATKSNPRSIGVEIAQIGAYPPGKTAPLERWYSSDEHGTYIDLPDAVGDGGVLTANFVGRPARSGLIEGRINGSRLVQHDFTPQQYASLEALIATLSRELPRIRAEVPRDAAGRVASGVLSDEEWRDFSGILGHYHVQLNKVDPGPAFDWERLLRGVRAQL